MRTRPPLTLLLLLVASRLFADPVPVKYKEGAIHGYLAIRSLDGKLLGAADLIQTIRGQRLTSRLTYRFHDGSIDDETAIFSQQGVFRLISDHHVQKGPFFPKPVDVTLQAATGEVTVRYRDKDQEKVETTHLDLPPDLANGILINLLNNLSPGVKETKLSFLVASPKPRLITISITPEGSDTFLSAGMPHKAIRYNLHLKLGGLAGLIAPMVGKSPPDAKAWISAGEVPAFIRSQSPLFLDGPVLRTELISPVWQTAKTQESSSKK